MVDQVTNPPQQQLKKSISELAAERREEMIQKTGEIKDKVEADVKKVDEQIKQTFKDIRAKVPNPSAFKISWYFQSEKDNFSFIFKISRKQVKFDGLYFKTDNPVLAAYITRCYGDQVYEIDKDSYEEGTQLRPGAPEPVKSSIQVNRLPERNT